MSPSEFDPEEPRDGRKPGTPVIRGKPWPALAIGIGCKRGCAPESIIGLVQRALSATGRSDAPARLFTLVSKADEIGLADAAKALGLPLAFLEVDQLRACAERVTTRSARVMRLFGVPSIAETAALAGAGPCSVLIVPRISDAGASCAIAERRAKGLDEGQEP